MCIETGFFHLTKRPVHILKALRFLSLSQAAACDGTRITTTTIGQEVAPGTLPISIY